MCVFIPGGGADVSTRTVSLSHIGVSTHQLVTRRVTFTTPQKVSLESERPAKPGAQSLRTGSLCLQFRARQQDHRRVASHKDRALLAPWVQQIRLSTNGSPK